MSAALLAILCGICLEDKVAATYDHALVQRALARDQVVVFAEPRTPLDPARLKAAASAAARVPGVDASSVRTSTAPASVSFVLDTRRTKPRAAVAAIGFELLKVVEPGAR